jgi:hypothetical protein
MTDEEFINRIKKLQAESYLKGIKDMCKPLIRTFREIALADGAFLTTFTAVQIIEILKVARDSVAGIQEKTSADVILRP